MDVIVTNSIDVYGENIAYIATNIEIGYGIYYFYLPQPMSQVKIILT